MSPGKQCPACGATIDDRGDCVNPRCPTKIQDPWIGKFEDYYELLEVAPTASEVAINGSYRALANHLSNRKGGYTDEAKMAKINAAHDVLMDKDARARYDRFCRDKGLGCAKTHTSAKDSSGPPPPPPPPPPPKPKPKAYEPVISVEGLASSKLECEEGQSVEMEFFVKLLSGDLPPNWDLVISRPSGSVFEDAVFTISPKNRLPAKVTVRIPAKPVGVYNDFLEISVEERKS